MYRISYRFLVPGWSAKPLVSAHDRIMGTHRLVNAWVRTSGPFCDSHSNHRKGRMIMAVIGIASHKDTLVGYLIDAGERLDNKTGPPGGAEPAGSSP